MQLIVRRNNLYLHIMWAYFEQKSFPLSEEDYRSHLNEILEVINRLGIADSVREWITFTTSKPRIGRALSFHIQNSENINEFIL